MVFTVMVIKASPRRRLGVQAFSEVGRPACHDRRAGKQTADAHGRAGNRGRARPGAGKRRRARDVGKEREHGCTQTKKRGSTCGGGKQRKRVRGRVARQESRGAAVCM